MTDKPWRLSDLARTDGQFQAAADHQVAINLRLALLLLMPMLLIILCTNLTVIERSMLLEIELTIVGVVGLLLVAYLLLARGYIADRYANAWGFLVICLLLIIPTVHMAHLVAMRQSTNFIIIVFAAGCILLSRSWLLAACAAAAASWSVLMWLYQPGSNWPHYAMGLALASALSFALQTMHLYHLRRSEFFREELAAGMAALQESEARYRGLIESQHDLIARVGTDASFHYVNDALCRCFGFSREALLTMDITGLIHAEDLAAVIEQGRAMTEPPHRARLTHRAHTPGGIRWFEWEASAIRNSDGSVTEVQGIGRDITDRVRAEMAANDREEYLRCVTEISRALLEAELPDDVLPEVVHRLRVVSGADRCYLYDIQPTPEGDRVAWPRTEDCAAGVDPHSRNPEVPGARLYAEGLGTWADVLEANGVIQVDRDQLTGLPQDLLTRQQVERMLMLPLQVHGEWRAVIGFDACRGDLCWSPQHVGLLQTAAYVISAALARAETERLVEQQRIQMIEQSKRASLWMMGSGLAHEINNPLAIISGAAEGISEAVTRTPPPVPVLKDLADRIARHVLRIAHIVRGLRTLTRDASQDPFEIQSIQGALDDALELCQVRFEKRGIQLDILIGEGDFAIACRPTQIAQVFLNLLNNAFDAVIDANDKWVRVTLEADADAITLAVSDSGYGIPAEVAATLFEPFQTSKPVGQGMGVGLSISKAIVENHGGNIALDAAAPHTRFVVRLPRNHDV